jgi:hypothetical protein
VSRNPDPIIRSAWREAVVVSLVWLCAMIWTITVCYRMGYNRRIEDLKLVFGFPDWIFWGIVVPWCLSAVVSCLFSALFFRDGNLGEDRSDTDASEIAG